MEYQRNSSGFLLFSDLFNNHLERSRRHFENKHITTLLLLRLSNILCFTRVREPTRLAVISGGLLISVSFFNDHFEISLTRVALHASVGRLIAEKKQRKNKKLAVLASMFLVSCGIHHNKKVIDITHISLTGFCLCKHRNTEHFFL